MEANLVGTALLCFFAALFFFIIAGLMNSSWVDHSLRWFALVLVIVGLGLMVAAIWVN